MPKVMKKRITTVANYVLDKLQCEGAYIGNKSVTTNSIYIKFKNPELRSLTIRDHGTREKYKYKWNLRMDMTGVETRTERGISRFFFGGDSVDEMIGRIISYSNAIKKHTKCIYQESEPMKIIEVDGNLLNFHGYDVILQQVNCQGVMGAGLARQIKEKFPKTYKRYNEICTIENNPIDIFGRCFIGKEHGKQIMNLFGQFNYGIGRQTDYHRLEQALRVAADYCKTSRIKSIGIPKKMGCGLAGGSWMIVLSLIKDIFKDIDIKIYIVDYKI